MSASFLRLGRISLDGRGRFEQERPPAVCDHLDLRQDLRFLFGRQVRLRIGELIELVLELGPELPAAERCGGPQRAFDLLHAPVGEIVQDVEHDPCGYDNGGGNDHGLDCELTDRSETHVGGR